MFEVFRGNSKILKELNTHHLNVMSDLQNNEDESFSVFPSFSKRQDIKSLLENCPPCAHRNRTFLSSGTESRVSDSSLERTCFNSSQLSFAPHSFKFCKIIYFFFLCSIKVLRFLSILWAFIFLWGLPDCNNLCAFIFLSLC